MMDPKYVFSNTTGIGIQTKEYPEALSTYFIRSHADGKITTRIDMSKFEVGPSLFCMISSHKGESVYLDYLNWPDPVKFPIYLEDQIFLHQEYVMMMDKELKYNYMMTSEFLRFKNKEETFLEDLPEVLQSIVIDTQKAFSAMTALKHFTTSKKSNNYLLSAFDERQKGYTLLEAAAIEAKSTFNNISKRYFNDSFKKDIAITSGIKEMDRLQNEIIFMYNRMGLETAKYISAHKKLIEYGYNPFSIVNSVR